MLKLTPKEYKMLVQAVDAFETVVDDDVKEYGERPRSDLKVYDSLQRKVAAWAPD